MQGVFDPVTTPRGRQLMARARQTNRERDAADRARGDPAPEDCTLDQWLRVAISAVACGIDIQDWGSVAEGLEVLQQAEAAVRRRGCGPE
jgi:hypothetical protein